MEGVLAELTFTHRHDLERRRRPLLMMDQRGLGEASEDTRIR